MVFKIDNKTLEIIESSRKILSQQIAIIGSLLRNVSNKKDDPVSKIGINIIAVSAEIVALEIIENIRRGHIVLSVIGLRTLFENFVNIHYIFHHPQHLGDKEWAKELCDDFVKRSEDNQYMKSKLGSKSLSSRAKEVYFEKFYEKIYIELSNYSHSLMSIVKCGDPVLIRNIRIEVSLYTIMFLQDSISAMISFFSPKLEPNINLLSTIDEINRLKRISEGILNKK